MVGKVFVYGTLRQRKHNHALMAGYSKCVDAYVEEVEIIGDQELVPMLTDGKGNCYGELYFYSDGKFFKEVLLPRLDRLEGHPGFYEREELEVFEVGTETPHKAWVYMKSKK